MRMDKLSVTAAEALQAAMGISADAEAAAVNDLHLLKALLESGERNLSAIIERVGADPKIVHNQVDELISRQPRDSGGNAGRHICLRRFPQDGLHLGTCLHPRTLMGTGEGASYHWTRTQGLRA